MMLIVKINGKYEQRILIIHFSSFIKHTNIILLYISYKHDDFVKKRNFASRNRWANNAYTNIKEGVWHSFTMTKNPHCRMGYSRYNL